MSRIASLSRRALGGGESARTFGRDAAARARPCRAHSTENAPPPRLARSHSRLARKIRHDVAPSRRVSAAGPAAGWLARSGRLFCSVCVCARGAIGRSVARGNTPPPRRARLTPRPHPRLLATGLGQPQLCRAGALIDGALGARGAKGAAKSCSRRAHAISNTPLHHLQRETNSRSATRTTTPSLRPTTSART